MALENTFHTVGQSMMQLAGARTKQTGNYNNISNRDRLIYKLIQEPYTSWPLQPGIVHADMAAIILFTATFLFNLFNLQQSY